MDGGLKQEADVAVGMRMYNSRCGWGIMGGWMDRINGGRLRKQPEQPGKEKKGSRKMGPPPSVLSGVQVAAVWVPGILTVDRP